MKIFKIILLMLVSCLTYHRAKSQEPNEIINKFFLIYEKDDSDKALEYLFSTNHWLEKKSNDDINNVKLQLKGFVELVGDYYGYDFISEKRIGDNLKLYTYIIKFDRQPTRFIFIFYKPKDKWMIYNFEYDQGFIDELKEAAKAFRLKENLDY